MEFGIFLNGYLPGPAAHDPASEHTALCTQLAPSLLASAVVGGAR